MNKYYIYKVLYTNTDKYYIGCTHNIKKRFNNHKRTPYFEAFEILEIFNDLVEASRYEEYYINLTWYSNINKNLGGYTHKSTKRARVRL